MISRYKVNSQKSTTFLYNSISVRNGHFKKFRVATNYKLPSIN